MPRHSSGSQLRSWDSYAASPIHSCPCHREYTFGVDKIFGPGSSQEEVYQEGGLEGVVGSVMSGTNACVFAYGWLRHRQDLHHAGS